MGEAGEQTIDVRIRNLIINGYQHHGSWFHNANDFSIVMNHRRRAGHLTARCRHSAEYVGNDRRQNLDGEGWVVHPA